MHVPCTVIKCASELAIAISSCVTSNLLLPSFHPSKATDAKHRFNKTAQTNTASFVSFVSIMRQKTDDSRFPIVMEQFTTLDKMSTSPNNNTSITIIVSSPKDGVVGK